MSTPTKVESANNTYMAMEMRDAAPEDSTTLGSVTDRNRFGTVRRKKKSHATALGIHATDWLPPDELERYCSMVSCGSAKMSDKSLLSTNPVDPDFAVDVKELKKAGLNLQEITRFVYDHLQRLQKDAADLPNFMRYVHLDQDGGLDRVCLLWNKERILWALMLVSFVIMNVLFLLQSNWDIFQSFSKHVFESSTHVSSWQTGNLDHVSDLAGDAAEGNAALDIYSHIQDPHRRKTILKLAGIVGTCEVMWVLVKCGQGFHQLRVFLGICDKSEYRQYSFGTDFFQDTLPVLSTFSLLKFVSFVHPSLIASSYFDMLQQRSWLPDSKMGTVLVTVYFLLSRLLIAVLAIGAFAMKLLAVALKLMDPSYDVYACAALAFLLMNQCMGAVMFERVLQDRLFLFIFGGSDTDFCEDELALKLVYRCRVSKQIWQDYFEKAGKTFKGGCKALVLLATFDHFDLQRLLINEPPEDPDVAGDGTGTAKSGTSTCPFSRHQSVDFEGRVSPRPAAGSEGATP